MYVSLSVHKWVNDCLISLLQQGATHWPGIRGQAVLAKILELVKTCLKGFFQVCKGSYFSRILYTVTRKNMNLAVY